MKQWPDVRSPVRIGMRIFVVDRPRWTSAIVHPCISSNPFHILWKIIYYTHTHTHTYDDSNRGRKSSRRKLRPLIAFRIDPEPVSRPFNRSRDLVIIAERDYIRARLILSRRLNTSIGVPGLCRLSWRNYLDYSLCWTLVVQGCFEK